MLPKHIKRARDSAVAPKPHKRANTAARGTYTQPIKLDYTQQSLSQRLSPRATSESRFRESQDETRIAAPTEGSDAATIATADAEELADSFNESLDAHLDDDFNGLDFERIPKYVKPLVTQRAKRSWVYLHGYRVALLTGSKQLFFVCQYCYQHKIIDAGGAGIYETTLSTSTTARHLSQEKRGHGYQPPGKEAEKGSQAFPTFCIPDLHGRIARPRRRQV
jgi:hypothetical protein